MSLKTVVNLPTVGNNKKNFERKHLFFVGIFKATVEKSRIRAAVIQWYRSADPDPY
jgi:hypothetical protein